MIQNNDPELRSAALTIGSDGYVLKTDAATELFSAITTLRNGHRPN
jgi:DNA-binding NarL/FixJ family response regulator